MNRDDPADPRLATWIMSKGVLIPETELVVSETLRERFTFCFVRVDDRAERLDLERGLIGLLTRHPLGRPSEVWLGRHAVHPAIRESGLWNTQHTGAPALTEAEFARLTELVNPTGPATPGPA